MCAGRPGQWCDGGRGAGESALRPREPQAPVTLAAKFSDPIRSSAPWCTHGLLRTRGEFYSEFAADTPVVVPSCYSAGIDKEQGWSLVLLQDLAPARNGSWVGGFSLADLRVAVAGIASAHAAWWQSPRLESAGWLSMTGFLAVEQMQQVVARCWQPFLARLSVPVTPAITEAGELATHHLRQVCTHLFETPPFTLVHHDFDGENLFFLVIDGQLSVAVIDWQLTTRARGPLDVAWLIGSQCEPVDRRKHELDLLQMYHRLLVEQGVSDYHFDQCWNDSGSRCSWPWTVPPHRLVSNQRAPGRAVGHDRSPVLPGR